MHLCVVVDYSSMYDQDILNRFMCIVPVPNLQEDADEHIDSRARGRSSPSPRYRDDRSDDEDFADQGQSRSRTRHRESSFDTLNRTSSNSNSSSSSGDKGANRRDAYDSSGRESYDKKDYRLSSKPVGSFHERHQQQQRDTTCTTYPLHPLGSSMGYRHQNSADYLEADLRGVHNNNYQANNNYYQANNSNSNNQGNNNY